MRTLILVVLVLVLGSIALVVVRSFTGEGFASFPPGTRAFEAQLNLDLLAKMMKTRREEYERSTDEARKEKLLAELVFFKKQAEREMAIVQKRDVSPGRGYVGVDMPPE